MKKIWLFFSVFFVMMGTTAYAHVKWFTNETPIKAPIEEIISPLFMIVSLVTALIISILPQLTEKVSHVSWIKKADEKISKGRKYTPLILRVGVSIGFLIQCGYKSMLAPEVHLTTVGFYLMILTIVCLWFPYGWSLKIASLSIVGMYLLGVKEMGMFHMVDYLFYLAIAAALFVQKTKYKHIGMPALYLGTGLSLCWVAVEKWIYPMMTMDVMVEHHIPTFGFSIKTFIVLSAFIEFVVGYLMMVGVLNRLLSVVLTGLFILTTTVFGGVEVSGHFIIHVILVVFIIEGTSFYKPPIKMHERKIDQIIFVFLNFLFILASIFLVYYRFG